jgi:lysophospholipase L1-like esterase
MPDPVGGKIRDMVEHARWSRFIALGDSFTEGVGDDAPDRPNGVRGWADRVAEQLVADGTRLEYANLAIRGRLLRAVLAEQLGPAVDMRPDLVTLYAGGNDLMRPKVDIDAIADAYDHAVGELARGGATVVLFTGVDGVKDPVFRKLRGRTAIYNEHVRLIARAHGCLVVDLWAMRQLRDRRLWAPDRLHLNEFGHTEVAREVLDTLGAGHALAPAVLRPAVRLTAAQRRAENLRWGREFALPWVRRRIRGESSGDGLTAKRPVLAPVTPS